MRKIKRGTYILFGGYFKFSMDASIETENYLLSTYDFPTIDLLKVGYHGSNTSSSNEFIQEINPHYSFISVGKKNRYGHPNQRVLDNLNNTILYRTDIDGSVSLKIHKNSYQIQVYQP